MESTKYIKMQKEFYHPGTNNHLIHNKNIDYWDILLHDLKEKDTWENKVGLDFGCGKGRNVVNMLKLCKWKRVDGVDISIGNINYCKNTYGIEKSNWFNNNGVDVSELKDEEYDFIMSTIVLQHIPVYNIRKLLISDLFRVLKFNGIFSFQMGFGNDLKVEHNNLISGYFDNSYNAKCTNGYHDVRITNPNDITNDLIKIGFREVKYKISDSFKDSGHPKWIFINTKK